MIEALLQIISYNNNEQNIDLQLSNFFSSIKQLLQVQAVGCYWKFNQEWYFSGEQNTHLSTQLRDMSKVLIAQPSSHQQPFIITANLNAFKCTAHFIHIYHQKNLIATLVFISLDKQPSKVKHDEINLLATYLSTMLAHAQATIEIKEHYYETNKGMIAMIESLDPYLKNHSKNVANYSLLLAKELKVSPEETEQIYYAALFHDIGKVGIPLALLQKPDALTPEEFSIIKLHPEKGAYILEQFSSFKPLVPMVYHHHEMWQGGGYPDGIAGEEIPFGARLIAVVDAYDALTTNRIYRKAQQEDKAIDIIIKNTPQQFDPAIVEAFIRITKNL